MASGLGGSSVSKGVSLGGSFAQKDPNAQRALTQRVARGRSSSNESQFMGPAVSTDPTVNAGGAVSSGGVPDHLQAVLDKSREAQMLMNGTYAPWEKEGLVRKVAEQIAAARAFASWNTSYSESIANTSASSDSVFEAVEYL
ncbi:MAG: hypothetical protein KDI13_08435 [Alphaproteobacteria bacterium]|nr:hypothetical protein [Alphaproteobacteria bacterium]